MVLPTCDELDESLKRHERKPDDEEEGPENEPELTFSFALPHVCPLNYGDGTVLILTFL